MLGHVLSILVVCCLSKRSTDVNTRYDSIRDDLSLTNTFFGVPESIVKDWIALLLRRPTLANS